MNNPQLVTATFLGSNPGVQGNTSFRKDSDPGTVQKNLLEMSVSEELPTGSGETDGAMFQQASPVGKGEDAADVLPCDRKSHTVCPRPFKGFRQSLNAPRAQPAIGKGHQVTGVRHRSATPGRG